MTEPELIVIGAAMTEQLPATGSRGRQRTPPVGSQASTMMKLRVSICRRINFVLYYFLFLTRNPGFRIKN